MKEKICGLRIFRWISGLKLWKYLSEHPLFGKICNYEMIMYIVCGVLTTAVNYVTYFLVPRPGTQFDVVIANSIAWITAVIFGYFVNKTFVFESTSWAPKTVLREFFSFVAARLLSFGFETLLLYVTVTCLHWNEPLWKILANIVVLIMNYIASKFFIFKKKAPETENGASEESEIE